MNVRVSKCLKEELSWAIDKRLRTKNLKNKTVFSLKQYCVHCYVTLSNVFQLMRIKI